MQILGNNSSLSLKPEKTRSLPISGLNQWSLLARKTKIWPLMISKPIVRTRPHSIVITPNFSMRVIAVLMMLAGFGYIFFKFFPYDRLHLTTAYFVAYSCFSVLGLIYGFTGLFLLTRVDKICWTPLSSKLEILRGSIFFSRRFYLPLDKIKPELVLSRHKELFKIVHRRSSCALLLKHADHKEIVRVAVAGHKEDLLPALGKLSTFVLDYNAVGNPAGIDKTMARVRLENGKTIRTNIGPLCKNSSSFKRLRPDFSQDKLTVFTRGLFEKLFWTAISVIGLGLLFITLPICMFYSLYAHEIALLVIFSLLLITIGGLGLIPGFDIQKIVFNKNKKTVALHYGVIDLKIWRARTMELAFDNVAAVQISAAHFDEWFTVYELNLVLVNSFGKRINITGYSKLDKIRRDGRLLANFLNKPFLDNSQL